MGNIICFITPLVNNNPRSKNTLVKVYTTVIFRDGEVEKREREYQDVYIELAGIGEDEKK